MKILLTISLAIFVEIFIFIQVGSLIGAMTAIMLTILSAAIGVSLVKSQASNEQMKAIHKMQEGKSPMKESLSSLCLLFAGVLLLLPGLVTDAIGALLLIPFLRNFFIGHALGKIENIMKNTTSEMQSAKIVIKGKPFKHKHSDETIDGVFTELHNDNSK
jgi:UPF0716 protein FxsA